MLMVKPPPIRASNDPSRIASCERKARYKNEATARTIGRNRLRDFGRTYRLWPYACARCRAWHLTSMEQNDTAITARELREGLG